MSYRFVAYGLASSYFLPNYDVTILLSLVVSQCVVKKMAYLFHFVVLEPFLMQIIV